MSEGEGGERENRVVGLWVTGPFCGRRRLRGGRRHFAVVHDEPEVRPCMGEGFKADMLLKAS